MFSSFNNDNTKQEICKYLNNVEGLITEETEEVEGGDPIKIQTVTLPESGKVIKAKGKTLQQAFSLVAAWNKNAKNLLNQVFSEQKEMMTKD